MRVSRLVIQSVGAGGLIGLLVLVLLLRLNPEVEPTAAQLALAWLVWFCWGALACGSVLAILAGAAVALAGRRWQKARGLFIPFSAAIFVVAAGTSRLNADLHQAFLSGSGHRTLGQDAVSWLAAAVLVVLAGLWAGRRPSHLGRLAVVVLVFALPLLRLVWQPTPGPGEHPVAANPLGVPSRPLLVIGVEGLDANFLLANAASDRFPSLQRLVNEGSWGVLHPGRPFLRRSLWTTTATGAYPHRHGVKSRWAWELPLLFSQPIRLLPWTPAGSGWLLPWGLTRRVPTPPSLLPPLWQRLRAAGVPTAAIEWPGVWAPGAIQPRDRRAPETEDVDLGADFRSSLEAVLEPFPGDRDAIWASVLDDLAELRTARERQPQLTGTVWVYLRALGTFRHLLQPRGAADTAERAVQEVMLELFDAQLHSLLAEAGPDALVVVVSPYGLAAPGPWERLKRLLGAGGSWHASARSCPDGILILLGRGVVPGQRARAAQLVDVTPTLCYLLRLPVAQSMEGRVILEAIDPNYLAITPLRVVD
jgi:hypothetical protein